MLVSTFAILAVPIITASPAPIEPSRPRFEVEDANGPVPAPSLGQEHRWHLLKGQDNTDTDKVYGFGSRKRNLDQQHDLGIIPQRDLDGHDTCSFCPDGLPDPELVLPEEQGGETCGTASGYASQLSDDALCATVQLAQEYCCPPEENATAENTTNATEDSISPTKELCSCSPRTYNFQLNLNQDCSVNDLENRMGTEFSLCSLERTEGEEGNIEITSIQFVEFDISGELNVINQDDSYQLTNLVDGDTVSFSSISNRLEPAFPATDQVGVLPGGVQLTIIGRVMNNDVPDEGNADQLVTMILTWSFTNGCEDFPVEDGDRIGWVTFNDIVVASNDFCPVAPSTSTPSTTIMTEDPANTETTITKATSTEAPETTETTTTEATPTTTTETAEATTTTTTAAVVVTEISNMPMSMMGNKASKAVFGTKSITAEPSAKSSKVFLSRSKTHKTLKQNNNSKDYAKSSKVFSSSSKSHKTFKQNINSKDDGNQFLDAPSRSGKSMQNPTADEEDSIILCRTYDCLHKNGSCSKSDKAIVDTKAKKVTIDGEVPTKKNSSSNTTAKSSKVLAAGKTHKRAKQNKKATTQSMSV